MRTRYSNQNEKNLKRKLEDDDFPSSDENKFEYDSEDSIELTNSMDKNFLDFVTRKLTETTDSTDCSKDIRENILKNNKHLQWLNTEKKLKQKNKRNISNKLRS